MSRVISAVGVVAASAFLVGVLSFTSFAPAPADATGNFDAWQPRQGCTIPQKPGRVIVDLKQGNEYLRLLVPWMPEMEKTVNLPAGKYQITGLSYDGYSNRAQTPASEQNQEQWKLEVYSGSKKLGTFGPTTDLEDGVQEDYNTDVLASTASFSSAVTKIKAVHKLKGVANPSGPHSVVPVCVAFDPIADVVPSCTLTPTSASIVKGGSVKLTWTSKNAESASMNEGIGSIPVNGNVTVSPTDDTTYTATFTSKDGVDTTCESTITVDEPVSPSCPLTSADGEVINLTTETIRANGPESGAMSDPVTVNVDAGEYEVWLASFDTHSLKTEQNQQKEQWKLSFRDSSGNEKAVTGAIDDLPENQDVMKQRVAQSFNVPAGITELVAIHAAYPDNGPHSVVPICAALKKKSTPPPPPPIESPQCDVNVSPKTIKLGESTTLSWTSDDVETASFNQNIGQVSLNGSRTVSPTQTTTYTGTFIAQSGMRVTCSDTVVVEQPEPAPTCDMFASPSTITKGGSATLGWMSSNVTDVTIDKGIGDVATSGDTTVSPTSNTTYTGTFKGANGDTITCKTTITVKEPTPDPAPQCTLEVTPSSVRRGESVTIAWTSDNATSASINQGIGSVSLDGDTSVSVDSDTTFTGTFTNGKGDTVTCSDSVTVRGGGGGGPCLNCGDDDDDDDDDNGGGDDDDDDEPSPTIVLSKVVRNAPGNFITLDQVPYTGFTAGPMLTALFWISVIGISAGLAYVLTYRRPFAFAMGRRNLSGTEGEYAVSLTDADTYSATEPVAARTATLAASRGSRNGNAMDDAIETQAHTENILFSPEALRVVAAEAERTSLSLEAFLESFFGEAKAQYPREDGWILLSKERATTLLIALRSQAAQPAEAAVVPEAPESPEAAPIVPVRDLVNERFSHIAETRTGAPMAAQPAAPQSVAQQPLARENQQAAPAPDFGRRAEMSGRQASADTGSFVAALARGSEADAFGILRSLQSSGGSVNTFLTEVVRSLDDVYKHRIEGNHNPDQNVAAAVAMLSNSDLEQLIGILVESVDYSYSSARVGSKVAIAKAIEFFRSHGK